MKPVEAGPACIFLAPDVTLCDSASNRRQGPCLAPPRHQGVEVDAGADAVSHSCYLHDARCQSASPMACGAKVRCNVYTWASLT